MLFGPIDAPLLLTSLISGFTAVSFTLQVRRRSKLIRAGIYVGLRDLAVVTDVWFNRADQLVLSTANDWACRPAKRTAIGNGILTATW